jgi:hypothetical protein
MTGNVEAKIKRLLGDRGTEKEKIPNISAIQ